MKKHNYKLKFSSKLTVACSLSKADKKKFFKCLRALKIPLLFAFVFFLHHMA